MREATMEEVRADAWRPESKRKGYGQFVCGRSALRVSMGHEGASVRVGKPDRLESSHSTSCCDHWVLQLRGGSSLASVCACVRVGGACALACQWEECGGPRLHIRWE